MKHFNFLDKIYDDIEKMIDNGELEEGLNALVNSAQVHNGNMLIDMDRHSKIYGKYLFYKGDRTRSMFLLRDYVQRRPDDEDAVLLYIENCLDLDKPDDAFNYLVRLMDKKNPSKKVTFFYLLYLISSNNFENAINLFKDLHRRKVLDVMEYIKISYYFLMKRRFDLCKDALLCGLSVHKGNTKLQEEFEYARQVEMFYIENIKKYYFPYIDKFQYRQELYAKGLRYMVEILSVRFYYEDEIELAADLLVEINKINFFVKYKTLAAICDYFLIRDIFEDWEADTVMIKFYGVKLETVKNRLNKIKKYGFMQEFDEKLEIIRENMGEYDYE